MITTNYQFLFYVLESSKHPISFDVIYCKFKQFLVNMSNIRNHAIQTQLHFPNKTDQQEKKI